MKAIATIILMLSLIPSIAEADIVFDEDKKIPHDFTVRDLFPNYSQFYIYEIGNTVFYVCCNIDTTTQTLFAPSLFSHHHSFIQGIPENRTSKYWDGRGKQRWQTYLSRSWSKNFKMKLEHKAGLSTRLVFLFRGKKQFQITVRPYIPSEIVEMKFLF